MEKRENFRFVFPLCKADKHICNVEIYALWKRNEMKWKKNESNFSVQVGEKTMNRNYRTDYVLTGESNLILENFPLFIWVFVQVCLFCALEMMSGTWN